MADGDSTIPVRVAVRCRPLTGKEKNEGAEFSLNFTPGQQQIFVKDAHKAFTYDFAFTPEASQDEVYDACVKQLVGNIYQGYNATVLAYGQTGSGKTHTMGTAGSSGSGDMGGVIQRAAADIFNFSNNQSGKQVKVKASFLEVYNEDIYDLFAETRNKDTVSIREDFNGVKVCGMKEVSAKTAEDVLQLLEKGALGRRTGSTNMNESSSRSHAIFTLTIDQIDMLDVAKKVTSKFHLVDLAGSERAKKTGAQGERFKEGININRGLLALGNVICALCENKNHIPYRDSKLTRLLQDSLGGNSHTVMIACISPADTNFEETLNTLRYADRARKIQNKPVVNVDPKTKELEFLRQTISQLEERWSQHIQLCPLETDDISPTKPKVVRSPQRRNTLSSTTQADEKLQEELLNLRAQMKNMFTYVGQLSGEVAQNENMKLKLEQLKEHVRNAVAKLQEQAKCHSCQNLASEMLTEIEAIVADTSMSKKIGDESENLKADDTSTSSNESGSEVEGDERNSLMQKLADINNTLAIKEKHWKTVSSSHQDMEVFRTQYEERIADLTQEINHLHIEKDQLIAVVQGPNVASRMSEDRRKKIQQLEQKLAILNKELQAKQRMLKVKEEVERKSKNLQKEIMELKQSRVRLMRQVQKDALRCKQLELQIKKRDMQADAMMIRNKRQLQKTSNEKAVLQRKLADAQNAKRKLEQALDKQRNFGKSMRKQTYSAEDINQWLVDEVSVEVHKVEARRHLDHLKEDRALLNGQLHQLEERLQDMDEQPPLKKTAVVEKGEQLAGSSFEDSRRREEVQTEMKKLKEELEERTRQISDLHEKLFHADSDPKGRFGNIVRLDEAREYLKSIFDTAVTTSIQVANLQQSQANSDALAEEVERLKVAHQKELQQERIANDEKVLYLINQVASSNLGNDDNGNEQFAEFKDKELSRLGYVSVELLKKTEECQQLQQEIEGLREARACRKRSSTIVEAQPPKSFFKPEPVYDIEEENSGEGNSSLDDPDWEKTPLRKKKMSRRQAIKQVIAEMDSDDESEERRKLKRNTSQLFCKCKTRCHTKVCGCQKAGRECTDACGCDSAICENRQATSDDADQEGGRAEAKDTTFVVPKSQAPEVKNDRDQNGTKGVSLEKRRTIYRPPNNSFFGPAI